MAAAGIILGVEVKIEAAPTIVGAVAAAAAAVTAAAAAAASPSRGTKGRSIRICPRESGRAAPCTSDGAGELSSVLSQRLVLGRTSPHPGLQNEISASSIVTNHSKIQLNF